ncbi:MAG TPA: PH domain-containing protein [Anaerolineaceae bacterium]|nr:PH domain-containing protein [Anaerolineaceae bacterium]
MKDAYLESLLGEQEKVLLLTRQHWFMLFKAILVEIVLAILIIIGVVVLIPIFPPGIIGLVLLVIPAVSLANDVMKWSNKKYVVTNRRVMQLSGVFNKNVVDSSLEKVNDVKMEQSFLGRLFQYGDIEILTASELAVNKFQVIGDPISFKTAMLNAKAALEREPFHLEGEDSGDDIPGLIQKLDDLRKQGIITEEEFIQKKIDLLAKL